MEEEKKQISFPSDYVTIFELQERWLKEKQLKQQQQQDHHNAVVSPAQIFCWEVPVSEIVVVGGVDGQGDSADQVGEEGEEAKAKAKAKKKKKKNRKKLKGKKLEKEVTGEGIEVQLPLANDEKEELKERRSKRSRPNKGKFRAELVDIDTKSRVLPAMVEKEVAGKEVVVQTPLTEGDKEDISGRRIQKSRKIKTRIKSKVGDSSVNGKKIYVRVEKGLPEKEAMAVNVNGEKEQVFGRRKQKSRARGKTRVESSNLNQKAHNKSVFASANGKKLYLTLEEELPVKQAPLTNDDEEDVLTRTNQESRSGNKAESSDLDQTADVALKFGGLSGTRSDFKAENNDSAQKAIIEPKFSALSLNGGTGENGNRLKRTSAHHNRGYRESSRYGSGRFGGREVHKPQDTRMVWVKKDEVSDGNLSGTQKPRSSRAKSDFDRRTKRGGGANAVA
ncbi:uncharacterized protein LOC133807037 isoform X2 [Humulus lupulus]|uniref:uncharacterized protein LOC133807037 isoform X2 n=1 Tax=Humulus lupulus TaxID=3486 RepID=UPI002B40517B|nr:uncharacterized protein LOC133807037 isoform X2 [Humulus lupulus]